MPRTFLRRSKEHSKNSKLRINTKSTHLSKHQLKASGFDPKIPKYQKTKTLVGSMNPKRLVSDPLNPQTVSSKSINQLAKRIEKEDIKLKLLMIVLYRHNESTNIDQKQASFQET
ncbi:LOW QUALITY PROTEIN: hypothetical protein YC2023_104024 [Brassica napus]